MTHCGAFVIIRVDWLFSKRFLFISGINIQKKKFSLYLKLIAIAICLNTDADLTEEITQSSFFISILLLLPYIKEGFIYFLLWKCESCSW